MDKFSVVLREADSAGMDFMAFKVVDDATLSKLKQELEAFGGLDVVEIEAGELAGCGRCWPAGCFPRAIWKYRPKSRCGAIRLCRPAPNRNKIKGVAR